MRHPRIILCHFARRLTRQPRNMAAIGSDCPPINSRIYWGSNILTISIIPKGGGKDKKFVEKRRRPPSHPSYDGRRQGGTAGDRSTKRGTPKKHRRPRSLALEYRKWYTEPAVRQKLPALGRLSPFIRGRNTLVAPGKGGLPMVTFADLFQYTLTLLGMAALIFQLTKRK